MSGAPDEDPDEARGMYKAHVLDHYRDPRNYGVVPDPDVDAVGTNPLCGDELRFTARLAGDRLDAVRFEGHGCALSQAAASMLTERVTGESRDAVAHLQEDDVLEMLGIPVSSMRRRCALLGLETLQKGLEGAAASDA